MAVAHAKTIPEGRALELLEDAPLHLRAAHWRSIARWVPTAFSLHSAGGRWLAACAKIADRAEYAVKRNHVEGAKAALADAMTMMDTIPTMVFPRHGMPEELVGVGGVIGKAIVLVHDFLVQAAAQ